MSRLVLYDYWRSSASYRVRIALALKRVAYRRVPVDLVAGAQRQDDHRARNPQGFVPVLEVDGERLTQSLAIIGWLDREYPDPPLLPADSLDRAHVVALATAVACDIHPLNNLRVLRYLAGPLAQPQEARDSWYRYWVEEGLTALEAMAAPRASRFLFGDSPTAADICLVPQLYNARRFNVPLDGYPTLLRADSSCAGLEPFRAAHPDAIAEADKGG